MKRKTVVGLAAPMVGAIAGVLGHVSVAGAEPSEMVLVLMDRSGTMSTAETCRVPGSTGTPRRWECGISEAQAFVSARAASVDKADYYFWQFRVFGLPPHSNADTMDPPLASGPEGPFFRGDATVDGTIEKRLADAKSQGPAIDDARTPMAAAYCNAVNWLKDKRAADYSPQVKLTIKLETDGIENETPPDSECKGDDGGDYVAPADPSTLNLVTNGAGTVYVKVNGLTVPSYQSYMLDKAITGIVHKPATFGQAFAAPFGSSQVISNATFLGEFLGLSALAAAGGDGPASTARPASATTSSSMSKDATFFNGLAMLTGGRLLDLQAAHDPGDPNAGHVIPGDANDDGCVNIADYSLVRQYYGQRVKASVPATFGADVTMDGVIDIYDYLLVKQKYGTGCSVPPGPAPQLGNAIFGFDDRSLWTSSVSLSTVGGPRTEGIAALKVGGSNYRELTTVPFNTAALQGITSKLAFDIFITATPVNPYWLGQTQILVNCPSAGIYNQFIGAVELTGRPLGKFTTVKYNLPWYVVNALRHPHSDFSIKIAVNQSDVGALVDNMRFVP